MFLIQLLGETSKEAVRVARAATTPPFSCIKLARFTTRAGAGAERQRREGYRRCQEQDQDVCAEKGVVCAFFNSYGFCVLKYAIFQVTLPSGKHKIVILDEADSMYADAPSHIEKL
jgi:hypothetical protein